MALAKSQQSLKNWSKQKWRTKSGKPSSKTGERYLPSAAIKAFQLLSMQEQVQLKEKVKQQENNLLNNQRV